MCVIQNVWHRLRLCVIDKKPTGPLTPPEPYGKRVRRTWAFFYWLLRKW